MGEEVVEAKQRWPVAVLAHPLAVVSLLGWALNDHVLKDRYHNALTGKLSDTFAMIVFPLLIALMLDRFFRRPMAIAIAVTTVFYSSINLFDWADGVTEEVLSATITNSALTRDPTDLVTLPVMVLAIWLWRKRLSVEGTIGRAWGRMMFASGVVVCMATSISEPITAPVSGTTVLTEEQADLTMPITFLLDGEVAPANLLVDLGFVAFGPGGGVDVDPPEDLVSWSTEPDSVTISLTDTTWAPVEVHWEIRGWGIDGEQACVIPWPGCKGPVIPEMTIDSPADDTFAPDASLALPPGRGGQVTNVVQSVVRLSADDVRLRFTNNIRNFTLHTNTVQLNAGTTPTPLPIPNGCDAPCDVTLWSVYRGWETPQVDLFGSAKVVTSTSVVLARAVSEQVTVMVSERDVVDRGVTVEFCASADAEFETELENQTTLASLRITTNGADTGASSTPAQENRGALFRERNGCVAENAIWVSEEDVRDGPVPVTGAITVSRLPGETPIEVELSHQIVQPEPLE